MVITGQQVGYLGGPLFTFLKAYHTTRLAAELEPQIGQPVLPVFWLEGEDHDLEEVRNAHYFDRSGELKSLRFIPDGETNGREVGGYRVRGDDHLKELAAALDAPQEAGLAILREAYESGTLSDGMGKLLARTLGERGLLIVEGMEPALKRMAVPLWEQIVQHGRELSNLLAERGATLRENGWSAILNPTPDSYLFYVTDENHVRLPLSYAGELRHPDGNNERLSNDSLQTLIHDTPERISPKAALRPLYQDFVLPSVAYVAGPGEMDYHAQIAPFYTELGVIPPVIFPRLSATILDRREQRIVEKTGLPIERLLGEERHAMLRELIHEQDEGRTAELFAVAKRDLENIYERLQSHIAEIDPTLTGAAQNSTGKSLYPLEQLREKTERALKQKHATLIARLDKALSLVKPQDQMSERVLSTGYYLAKYGTDKLLDGLDAVPLDAAAHAVIELETN